MNEHIHPDFLDDHLNGVGATFIPWKGLSGYAKEGDDFMPDDDVWCDCPGALECTCDTEVVTWL